MPQLATDTSWSAGKSNWMMAWPGTKRAKEATCFGFRSPATQDFETPMGTSNSLELTRAKINQNNFLVASNSYCGVGSFITRSHSNLLNVVFEAGAKYNPGSRFMCELVIKHADSETVPVTQAPPLVTARPQPSCACGRRYSVSVKITRK